MKNNLQITTHDFLIYRDDNNNVIGIMKIKPSNRSGYEECGEIQVLYLYPNEKGKGYGKALINIAFEVLKNKGYKKVVIGCLVGNPSMSFINI